MLLTLLLWDLGSLSGFYQRSDLHEYQMLLHQEHHLAVDSSGRYFTLVLTRIYR